MKIEMSLTEIRNTFGFGNLNDLAVPSLVVNGVKYYVWEYTEETVQNGYYNHPARVYTLILHDYEPPKPKSKEEIAAEEAVKKAEESLKAAMKTLEKIKEK